jgi:hypothetical protein
VLIVFGKEDHRFFVVVSFRKNKKEEKTNMTDEIRSVAAVAHVNISGDRSNNLSTVATIPKV